MVFFHFVNGIWFSLLASVWHFVLFELFTEKAIGVGSALVLGKSSIASLNPPLPLAIDIITADWCIDAYLVSKFKEKKLNTDLENLDE